MSMFDHVTSAISKYPIGSCILKISFYLTAVIIAYHHTYSTGSSGRPDLFKDAQLFDSPDNRVWFYPLECSVRQFNDGLTGQCLKSRAESKEDNRVLFVGDSSASDLFLSLVHLIQPNYTVQDIQQGASVHDEALALFLEYRYAPDIYRSIQKYKDYVEQNNPAPRAIVHGMGWTAEKVSDMMLDPASLEGNWTMVVPYLQRLCKTSYCLWMPPDPIGDPSLSKHQRLQSLSNDKVYSSIARRFLEKTDVIQWTSSQGIAEFCQNHADSKAAYYKAQVLLNWLCNQQLLSPDGAGTCFTDWVSTKPFTYTSSIISLAIVLIVLVHGCLSVYTDYYYLPTVTDADQVKKITQILEVSGSIVKLALIMTYFHLCDREDGIMKEDKHYSPEKFFIPLVVVTIIGLLSLKKSDDYVLLNRFQTEEWKGWMQLVILIYHITGASKVLPIYFSVRLLVTSYLFLNGYGQFTFFFLKGNFGLMRVLQTFIRLNLLVILLCLVMSRPYQFYYFVPLVSFWFVIIYCIMAVWPKVTTSVIDSSKSKDLWYAWMGCKLGLLVVLMTVLVAWEELFNLVFGNPLLGPLFMLNNSVHEWRFRWQLDRYSVVCGMAFGLVYQYLRRNQLIKESQDTSIFPASVTRIISAISLTFLVGYAGFALLCNDKFKCNVMYPYFGFLPILGFVLLRNMLPSTRSSYSLFFAWFGKISLELFISQYHIWLADDTKKVLVLIPGYPVVNILTTSLIFVSVCCEIQTVTSHFASYFTPRVTAKPPVLPTS